MVYWIVVVDNSVDNLHHQNSGAYMRLFRKLKQNTGKPVFGTIPLTKFLLPEEDSITSNSKQLTLNSHNLKKIDSEIEKLSKVVKSSLNIRQIEKLLL